MRFTDVQVDQETSGDDRWVTVRFLADNDQSVTVRLRKSAGANAEDHSVLVDEARAVLVAMTAKGEDEDPLPLTTVEVDSHGNTVERRDPVQPLDEQDDNPYQRSDEVLRASETEATMFRNQSRARGRFGDR